LDHFVDIEIVQLFISAVDRLMQLCELPIFVNYLPIRFHLVFHPFLLRAEGQNGAGYQRAVREDNDE